MGGLVIKRAYLLAKGKQDLSPLAARIQAILFLATPHRGSDLAQTFSKILGLSGGSRPFVADLHRDSLEIRSINEEFPQHCADLSLYSFYETLPTSFGVRKVLVVERDLATLGYANERREYLAANHREVCKFSSPDDLNYRTVRNALAFVLHNLRDGFASSKREIENDLRRHLAAFFGVSEAPEDNLMSADSLRMAGSGEWLINKRRFQDWLHSAGLSIFCVIAKPATGKTVLTGKVISHLRESGKGCSFFFFQHGNKDKSSITSFLLSMAWQMALSDQRVLATCLEISENDDGRLRKADYRTIWRKLFLEGILKVTFERTQYWVIDALDECKDEPDIIPLLMKAAEGDGMRIFLTSRNRFEPHQKLGPLKVQVHTETILEENSKSDIALYLNANMDDLPSVDENGRQHMVRQILEKSMGCFLWVSLVLQELKNVHTSTDVERILDKVPTDMNELYNRILDSMSAASYGKHLTKAILTWTVCSTRPLKTFELHVALQLDIKDSTDSIEASIRSCCGQLVYVDAKSQVQMIHLTARDFLLHTATDSEFVVDEREGHRRLLLICLQYLSGDDMKAPRRGRFDPSKIMPKDRSAFASYACDSLSEHLSHLSWEDNDVLSPLANFFRSSNVLSWIEYVARNSDQHRLIQTGNSLRKFLEESSEHNSPSNVDIELLESWATDLVRLVMKFGGDLESYPSSIFHLVPSFCPPTTAPRKQFGSAARSITVCGLRAQTWDECLSTVADVRESYSCLASSKTKFAIGCFSGKILLFKQTTFQEVGSLYHAEPLRLLKFGDEKNVLVSAGSKSIRVWNFNSKAQLHKFDARQQCMALALVDQDGLLLAAMKDHRLKIWDLNTGDLTDNVIWTQSLGDLKSRLYRRPIAAAFNEDTGMLAIVYKGHDILLLDLEDTSAYDMLSREAGASGSLATAYGSAGVRCLVSGRAASANLVAAAYVDGELVLFDTSTGDVLKRLEAFSHILCCSPDGSTLAAGDPAGTIQLFKFETLQLLYRISSVEPGLQGLAFSGDGERLLDIRGSQCRVWGPTVLVRQSADEAHRNQTTTSTTRPLEISLDPEDNVSAITSVACHNSGEVFFCGKEDGTIHLYNIETGLTSRVLFSHAHGVAILSLHFEEESHTLSSIDASSRVMIHSLTRQIPSIVASSVLFDYRANLAVRQLVCEKGLNHILVCTARSDMLWSISKEGSVLLNTTPEREREPYAWVNHPSNAQQLILMTHNEAHIYEWETLQRLTAPEGISLEGDISPELLIPSITPCFNGTVLATMFSESKRPQSKSKLVLWSTSEFTPEAKVVRPIPAYQALSDRAEVLVGATSADPGQGAAERMVFLHNGNWVCAADADAGKEDNFVRHFFFPADWLSTNLDLILEVTKKGDVLLVKRDEVAVVRKGLLTNNENADDGGSSTMIAKRGLFSRRNRKP